MLQPIPLKESLPILEVSESCSKEFSGTSRFDWLVNMALAIYAEPAELVLRPDKTWDRRIQTGHIICSVGTFLDETERRNRQRLANEQNKKAFTVIEYDRDKSKLKKLTEPLSSTGEPPRIGLNTFVEEIHRDDFRAWLESINHPLPRFWFGSETTATAEPPPRTTPEEIVSSGHTAGNQPWEIAYELDAEFKGSYRLTPDQLGRLLPANPGTTIAPDSDKKRGQRLRRQYKKILNLE